jgi:hypothetical protein
LRLPSRLTSLHLAIAPVPVVEAHQVEGHWHEV